MKKNLPLFVAVLAIYISVFAISLKAQSWDEKFVSPDKSFYQIQKSFNDFWKDKDNTEKGKGWKAFKRWEWFWGQRVYPSGNFPNPDQTYIEYQRLNRLKKDNKMLTIGSWSNLGPTSNSGGYGGLGRINVIRESPSNSNTLFAGAASGGLWKSTNSGSSWTTNTDELASLGVTDIVFDPSNSSVMYMATGDGDHSDTYSVGVLKSSDGGSTWNTTGLNWTQSNNRTISRLLINPSNNQIIYAGGSSGIYKSTNGGTNWTLIFSSMSVKDMEFKPGTPSTIFAVRNSVYRSTDDGANWTRITSGLPTSGIERIAIAVSPANSDYVYALISSTSNSGFLGLYRSTDGGLNWTSMSTTPNILGWNATGSDTGGQGWYDLAVAVSPTNANEVYTGGVNIWKSTNGGTNWSRLTYWNSGYSPTVHADQHDLWFAPGSSRLYAGNDGGVYLTSNGGTSWSWLGNGMEITQFYRIGNSATNSSVVIGGAQDNGTKLKSGTSWTDVIGGDGMECIVSHANANVMYGEIYYGSIRKSTNGGANWSSMTLPSEYSSGYGAWVTPYIMHPTDANTLYIGYKNLFKSTDAGSSWSQISNFASGILTVLHVAPSNPDYIYCSTGSSNIRMTSNGGTSWSEYSLPAYTTLTYLAVSNNDPQRLWAAFSGYTSGSKVYQSTNGGQSWTNISGTIPNVPVNTIVYQNNYNNRLYVGTDIGVMYRDDNSSDWVDFSTNLPNVVVTELEIQYSSGKLRAATFGRGLWEAEIPTTVLSAPTLVSPSNSATDVAINPTLIWNAVSGATSYTTQYSTSSSFASYTENTNTSTSLSISGLSNYTTYYWRVKAYDGSSYSNWSSVSDFRTVQLTLSAPDLSSPADNATGQSLNLNLSWNTVTNATGYTVQYSTANDFSSNVQSSVTTASAGISGLDYNTTYYWRVKATAGQIESNWSSVRTFTTEQLVLDAPSLSTPANTATNQDISLSMSWSAVNNATGYTIQYSTVNDFSTNTESSVTTTSQSITGLSYNTTYYWRVKATAGQIESEWSTVFSFTTVTGIPEAPTLSTPANGSTGIAINTDLTWYSVQRAISYTVQYSTSSNFGTFEESTTSSLTQAISNLTYNQQYYWRVKAYDGNVYSDWSEVYGFTTEQLTLSTPVLSTPADDANSVSVNATLAWGEVTNATSYTIQYSTSSDFSMNSQTTSTSTNYGLNGLAYNTIYYWKVKAKNGQIESQWSNSRKFKTEQLTLAVPTLSSPSNAATGVSADPQVSYSTVSNATGYIIEYSTASDFAGASQLSSSTGSATISDLNYNTKYYWRVKATNGDVSSNWSSSRNFTTANLSLSSPGLLKPKNKAYNVSITPTLTWSAASNAEEYEIQISIYSNFSSYSTLQSTSTSVSAGTLSYGRSYYWRAKSIARNITSGWSSSRTFKTVSAKESFGIEDVLAEDDFSITPNPAKEYAHFTFSLGDDGRVDIEVYSASGDKVLTVTSSSYNAGVHTINIDVSSLSSGMYVAIFRNGDIIQPRRFVIVK